MMTHYSTEQDIKQVVETIERETRRIHDLHMITLKAYKALPVNERPSELEDRVFNLLYAHFELDKVLYHLRLANTQEDI